MKNNITLYFTMLLIISALSILVFSGCGGCREKDEKLIDETIETEDISAGDAEIKELNYSGNLRVVSTDGSYIHEVILLNSEGDIVAKGDTGNPFTVPEGTFDVQVQGYTFPVTVERDKHTIVRVAEEMGLGKLRMISDDGSYIHPVVVTDMQDNVVAEGRSGFYIDLSPGKYRAAMRDLEVDVEIKKGETTYIRE